MLTVQRARFSRTWFGLNPAAFASPVPAAVQVVELGRSLQWQKMYSDAALGYTHPCGLADINRPWHAADPGSIKRMWNAYVAGDETTRFSARAAWNNAVPLLATAPLRLDLPILGGCWRGLIRTCLFPHGVGVLADLELHLTPTQQTLAHVADTILDFLDGVHTWGSGHTGSLDLTAVSQLKRVSRAYLGSQPKDVTPPLSCVTVVEGRHTPEPTNTAILRQIVKLSDWRRDADTSNVDDLKTNEVVYAGYGVTSRSTPTGAFLWSPSLLTMHSHGLPAVADLHRSTMWMGLQTDALGRFLRWFDHLNDDKIPPAAYSLRRTTAQTLTRLLEGHGAVPAGLFRPRADSQGYSDAVDAARRAEQLAPGDQSY